MQVQDRRKQIEERAYELWERAGRPDGRALEYWVQAESEVVSAKPARSRPRRAAGDTVSAAAAQPRRSSKVTPIGKAKAPAAEKATRTSTRK